MTGAGSSNSAIGREGEDAAAAWYAASGFEILDRNWRARFGGRASGELDLVCTADDQLVFVEVKTRTSARFGTGAEAVGRDKQRRLRRISSAWLAQADRSYGRVRFDVAEVDRHGEVTVWEACF